MIFVVLPNRIRIDRGTETGVMTTMHYYLVQELYKVDTPKNVFYLDHLLKTK